MKSTELNYFDSTLLTEYQGINDYQISSKQNSISLIRLVRHYQLLYDYNAEGYNDKFQKEYVWETIHKTLFPEFDELDENTKVIIRTNVRRRWKALRGCMARELKKDPTLENVLRKRSDPLFSELEFLIPYIRASSYTKLANDLNEFHNAQNDMRIKKYKQKEKLSTCCFIDLSEDDDIKPEIKTELKNEKSNTESSHYGGSTRNQFVTDDAVEDNTSAHFNWSNEFCAVAEYRGGEFTNPAVLCTSQNISDNTVDELMPNSPKDTQNKKKTSADHVDAYDRQESRLVSDSQDEDRMFLMSLVPELRRVNPVRKMLVKAEIARIIAKAMTCDH